jgi:DNA mismatch repair protein MutS2
LGGEGEVTGFSDDMTGVDVQMGAFKVRQPLSGVRKLGSKPKIDHRPAPSMPPPRREVDMELHLRGQRAAGVDQLVDEYLHDAYLSRLPFVRIVHGKGTGALRDVVRDVLRGHPLVEKFETPPHYEGGDGVTVVYLRDS